MRVSLVGMLLATLIVSAATPLTAAAAPLDDWIKTLNKMGIVSSAALPLPGKGPICMCLSGAGVDNDVGVIQRILANGQLRLSCEVPTFTGGEITDTDSCTDWVLIPRKN